jgi:AraC-like DNA-binding protein
METAAATPVALMRVAGLTPIVVALRRDGAPVARLLQRARLPARVFDRPEALIPTGQAARFIEDAAGRTGWTAVAATAARETPIEALGMFGRRIRRSRTVEDAIVTAVRIMPAFDSGSRCRLERSGTRVHLSHECNGSIGAGHGLLNEYRAMLWANALDLAAERTDEVQRRGPTVSFAAALLGRSFPPASPPCVDDDDVEAWEESAPARDLAGSVLQVIQTLWSTDHPRIGAVASAIGTSVRALQRRLAEAGMTFEGLVAHGRFGTAVHLLEETDARILDIALDLGYSDHAHFTRAFRRWTGIPPREFRRMNRRPTSPRLTGLRRRRSAGTERMFHAVGIT